MEAEEFMRKLRELRGEAAEDAAPVAAVHLEEEAEEEITRRTARMWKYRLVEALSLEPFPEELRAAKRLVGAELFGARVRGKKHKHDGSNSDDWFALETLKDWAVVAVSDGAGSKRFSRIGARASCETAVSYIKLRLQLLLQEGESLCAALAQPLDSTAFSGACARLAAAVQEGVLAAKEAVGQAFVERSADARYSGLLGRPLALGDFAATLLVAVIVPVAVGCRQEHVIVSCQIGDGMIAAVREGAPPGEALCLLGQPDSGRYAGETEFLTSGRIATITDLMARTTVARREISAVLAMTDGVADDYFPHAPQLLRLYLDLQLNGVLDGLRFYRLRDLPANLAQIKRLPEPEALHWVNDPSMSFALQSSRRVLAATGLRLEELWGNRDLLYAASLHTFGMENEGGWSREKLLEIWLDSYRERGSFDDRTLVVFRRKRRY